MKPISDWTDDELRDIVGGQRYRTQRDLAAEVLRLRGEIAARCECCTDAGPCAARAEAEDFKQGHARALRDREAIEAETDERIVSLSVELAAARARLDDYEHMPCEECLTYAPGPGFAHLKAEKDAYMGRAFKAEAALAARGAMSDALSKALGEARAALVTAKGAYSTHKRMLADLRADLAAAREVDASRKAQVTEYGKSLEFRALRIQRLEADLAAARRDYAALADMCHTTTAELAAARTEISEADHATRYWQAKVQEVKNELAAQEPLIAAVDAWAAYGVASDRPAFEPTACDLLAAWHAYRQVQRETPPAAHAFEQHPKEPNNGKCQYQAGFDWGPRCGAWKGDPIHRQAGQNQ